MKKLNYNKDTKLPPMGIWIYSNTYKKLKRKMKKTGKTQADILRTKLKKAYSYYSHKRFINDKIQAVQNIIERISEEYCENEFIDNMISHYEKEFIHQELDIVQNALLYNFPESKKKKKISFRPTKEEQHQLQELQEMLPHLYQADVIALLFESMESSCDSEFVSHLCFLQTITNYIAQKVGDRTFQKEVNTLWETAHRI